MGQHPDSHPKWVRLIIRNPGITLGVILCLTIVLSWGITGINLSASPREYQGMESPRVQELIRIEGDYSTINNVMVMFSVKDGSVFRPQALRAIKDFTKGAWQITHAQRVDSITNFQFSHALGDELVVEDLVPGDPLGLAEDELTRIRSIALNEPRLLGLLVAPDGKSTAVNIKLLVDLKDSGALLEIERQVDALIEQTLALYPAFQIHETGFIEVGLGWLNAMTFDASYMFTSAFILMFATLVLFFRSVMIALATMLLGVMSITASLGLAGYFGASIHPPAMIGTLVILMLALADAVHIVKRARKLLAEGLGRREAIAASLRFNVRPVFITSLTTAIGFLSFLASEFSGIRFMGVYVAFGVMYACLLSLTYLPALLSWVSLQPGSTKKQTRNAEFYEEWIFRLRWVFVGLTVPVIVMSALVIARTPLDDSPIRYISESQEFRKDQQAFESQLTGSVEVVVELDSGQPQGVSNPRFMRDADRFSEWLRGQPNVRSVSVYTDTMKHLNRNMHGDQEASYRLPESQELAAQYLLLYELSLPYGLDLTNQINFDKSATRLSMTINDMMAVEMLAFSKAIEDWLASNAPTIIPSKPGGDTLSFTIASLESHRSMFVGALSALSVIGIVLLIAFRQLMPGIICTIMVVSPISVSFGIWSLAIGYLDAGATLAMSMVIGIVVDSAVHFVSRYQVATRELKLRPRAAVRHVLGTVSGALTTNALVLAASFSILMFSAFTANAEMGILTVMSLLVGLIGTFTLLPSLLIIWGQQQRANAAANAYGSTE